MPRQELAHRWEYEINLNDIGYRLLREHRSDEAIQILTLNTELYPGSANAFDSLGEAYMLAGETGLAIRNYGRSLELNPHNPHGIEMLQKLQNN